MMIGFAEKYLGMQLDGIFTWKEGIIAAVLAMVVLLAVFFVVRKILERSHIRKTSIFRVKKNKYKSRLGKNNIKY
ncbi:MAG: hypothetical protein IJ443_07185 [Firmicutes bacterium]|nr:hypothetical protein [Bacillota bacterium]